MLPVNDWKEKFELTNDQIPGYPSVSMVIILVVWPLSGAALQKGVLKEVTREQADSI